MECFDVLTSRIADALEREHCGLHGEAYVTSCDIYFAFEHELYLWAAHLLVGATECPRTERAYIALEKYLGTEKLKRRLESERLELLTYPHRRCPRCNSVTWADDEDCIESCGECGYTFRADDPYDADDVEDSLETGL